MKSCLLNTGVIVWCVFWCCETISTEIMLKVADNFKFSKKSFLFNKFTGCSTDHRCVSVVEPCTENLSRHYEDHTLTYVKPFFDYCSIRTMHNFCLACDLGANKLRNSVSVNKPIILYKV